MNDLAVYGLAAAGALAGIPAAAVAYSAPARGSIRLPTRWWCGEPANPAALFSVSLLIGTATGVVAARLPWSPATPAYCIFAIVGVGLAIIDVRHHRLPHVLTGILWATSTAGLIVESLASGHVRALVTGTAAGACVAASALLIAFTMPGQLGLGDVSLSGVIALSLGGLSVEAAALGLLAGVALQACIALGGALRNPGRPGNSHLPFGPALLVGWFIALLVFAS